jgi:dihydroflavonol-4-reductase
MTELHVVTGATGHLGANLVPALLDAGHRVRVVTIEADATAIPALDGLEVERVQGDVRDRASLATAFTGAAVVHHLAAMISVRARPGPMLRTVNVDGVANVVAACSDAGVGRLVHVSSIHATSSGRRVPAYDRSKAAGERIVLAAVENGLDAVVIRPTGIVGPRDHAPSRMGQLFLDFYHRRLPALITGGFNWVDVRDVANAIATASHAGRRGSTYTVSGYWRSLGDLARLSGSVTGVRPPLLRLPHWLARSTAPVTSLTSDRFTSAAVRALRDHQDVGCTLALRDLGHWPRPLTETVADIYAWFDAAGMLQPAGVHRGSTTPSMGDGNTTDTGMPMVSVDGSTESSGASAPATTLPTRRTLGSSVSATTATL